MALYRTTTVIGEDVKNGSCTPTLKEVSNTLCDPVVRWGSCYAKVLIKLPTMPHPPTSHDQCI